MPVCKGLATYRRTQWIKEIVSLFKMYSFQLSCFTNKQYLLSSVCSNVRGVHGISTRGGGALWPLRICPVLNCSLPGLPAILSLQTSPFQTTLSLHCSCIYDLCLQYELCKKNQANMFTLSLLFSIFSFAFFSVDGHFFLVCLILALLLAST